MAKSITVSPAATYPLKRKSERKMATTLKAMFKGTKKHVLPKLVDAYREVVEEHRKGLRDELDYILKQLDLSAWEDSVDDLSDPLSDVQSEAGQKALTQLGVDDSNLFDQVNADAVAAATDRAASLVGMKYVDGELVENPSAEYAITEATRSGIKDMVTDSLTKGMTVGEFSTALTNTYQFSDLRAETIARTEIATAHVQGTLTAWKATGQVATKSWLVGSGETCDECEGNEEDGDIGLDEDFSSGDDAPPAHPNCVCTVLAGLTDESED